MTKHDIKLPARPAWADHLDDSRVEDIDNYARAAIKADRQQCGGEPVGAPSDIGRPSTLEMYLNPRPIEGGNPVYLYRRRGMGMTYFMSTTKEQYDAYSERPDLIETITLYTAPQPAAPVKAPDDNSVDGCTDPDNCRRCQTIPEHRGDMKHAGIGSYPSAQEPSDEELIAWASEEQFFLFCDEDEFLDIARALLARYGSKS